MKIKELFEKKDIVFSFEVFPPKQSSSIETVYNTLDAIKKMKEQNPDFISVTYGAGGSTAENRTAELSSIVKNKLGVEAMAHLTCLGAKTEQIDLILDDLKKNNIENILALRGDRKDVCSSDFSHADELISYIKQKGDFEVCAACYPEKHPEAKTLEEDLAYLKHKQDCGADSFITQMFFDNDKFLSFYDKIRNSGITIPVHVGIMPIINKNQISRIAELSGAYIPKPLRRIFDNFGNNPTALRDAGINYAIWQITELLSNGINSIHLYTMNNPQVAEKVTAAISGILRRD